MIDMLNIVIATNSCILSTLYLTCSVIFLQTLHINCPCKGVTLSDVIEDKVMVCEGGMVFIQLCVALRKFTLSI